MIKLTDAQKLILKSYIKSSYADLGVAATIALILDKEGFTVTKNQLTRTASQMGIVVSAATKGRLAKEAHKKTLTRVQIENRRIIKKYYSTRGSRYPAELTGLSRKQVVSEANKMGLHLTPELKRKNSIENIRIRRDNKKKKDNKPVLTELERLALGLS